MIKPLTHLGMCLGEVLVVHSKSLVQELSPWTILCVGASAAATAWSFFHEWHAPSKDVRQWQEFGLGAQACRVTD